MARTLEAAGNPRAPARPASPAERFAAELRALRDEAGRPTFRQMARRACSSAASLCRAVAGDRLPSLDVTLGFVDACGGDRAEWAARWRAASAAQQRPPRAVPAGAVPAGGTPAHQATEGPAGGRAAIVPAQLPPATAGFVGRSDELRRLAELMQSARTEPGRVGIATISGLAGSGKTALALHFAHQVADRFPDGQLYADLRGFAVTRALSVHAALGLLLEGLGVPQAGLPGGTEQRSALYRSMMATRRMLVVLDNALSPDQVSPLLPGTAGCLVLVTSRKRLAGLVAQYGVRAITLDVLSTHDAVALLAAAAEPGIREEPQAAADLAALCGFLPLALRIAAANLSADSGHPLADMVRALSQEDRLRRLEVDEGPAVSAALDLSYRRLPDRTARVFRLLGLLPGAHFTAPAVAALASLRPAQAQRELDQLLAVHLIQRSAAGRFQFHDLVGLFASQCGGDADPAAEHEGHEALRRLAGFYVNRADEATGHLDRRLAPLPHTLPVPHHDLDTSRDQLALRPGAATAVMAWLDDERATLVSVARRTSEQPPLHAASWELADALQVYFQVRRHVADGLAVAGAGLSAALRAGDRKAEAAMRSSLANGYRSQGLFQRAADEYARALAASRDSGWRAGEAELQCGFASARVEIDPPERALENYQQALHLWREVGDQAGEARTLADLACALLWKLGRLAEARGALTRAVTINEQLGSSYQVGFCLVGLGLVEHELGHLDEALALLTRAHGIHRANGARALEAVTLCDLGGLHRDLGHFAEALDLGRRALELSREIGDWRVATESHNALADCHLLMGSGGLAEAHAQDALRIAGEIGYRYGQARAEIRLASALLLNEGADEATGQAASAVTLARTHGYRMLEGNALTVLARTALARGGAEQAARTARQAIALLRETGHRPGEEAAARVLEEATARGTGRHRPSMLHQAPGDATIPTCFQVPPIRLRIPSNRTLPTIR